MVPAGTCIIRPDDYKRRRANVLACSIKTAHGPVSKTPVIMAVELHEADKQAGPGARARGWVGGGVAGWARNAWWVRVGGWVGLGCVFGAAGACLGPARLAFPHSLGLDLGRACARGGSAPHMGFGGGCTGASSRQGIAPHHGRGSCTRWTSRLGGAGGRCVWAPRGGT